MWRSPREWGELVYKWVCVLHVQWNLRIKDTLGPGILFLYVLVLSLLYSKNEHLEPQSVSLFGSFFSIVSFKLDHPPTNPLPRNKKTIMHIREPGRIRFSRHRSFYSNHRVLPNAWFSTNDYVLLDLAATIDLSYMYIFLCRPRPQDMVTVCVHSMSYILERIQLRKVRNTREFFAHTISVVMFLCI